MVCVWGVVVVGSGISVFRVEDEHGTVFAIDLDRPTAPLTPAVHAQVVNYVA